jgi:hypothetical protein
MWYISSGLKCLQMYLRNKLTNELTNYRNNYLLNSLLEFYNIYIGTNISTKTRVLFARCEVFPAVKFQVEVCWVLIPCSVVVGYQRFRGLCCLKMEASTGKVFSIFVACLSFTCPPWEADSHSASHEIPRRTRRFITMFTRAPTGPSLESH